MKIMLAMVLTVSVQAFANPNAAPNEPGKVSKEEVKAMYDLTCTPGSAQYDKKESVDFRNFMIGLMQNPTAVLTELKKDESFGGVLALGITCGFVVLAKDELKNGCTTPNGGKVDATEAIRQCEEIVQAFQKQNEAEEVEPQP